MKRSVPGPFDVVGQNGKWTTCPEHERIKMNLGYKASKYLTPVACGYRGYSFHLSSLCYQSRSNTENVEENRHDPLAFAILMSGRQRDIIRVCVQTKTRAFGDDVFPPYGELTTLRLRLDDQPNYKYRWTGMELGVSLAGALEIGRFRKRRRRDIILALPTKGRIACISGPHVQSLIAEVSRSC